MGVSRVVPRIVLGLSMLSVLCACQSPQGYKYKFSPYTPSSASLWEAYTEPFPSWWRDSKKLAHSGVESNFSLQPNSQDTPEKAPAAPDVKICPPPSYSCN